MSKEEKTTKVKLDGVITDKRFARLHSDPRFMRLPRNKFKVQIDSRFQRMFSDKNFSESLAFDKRGRPKKKRDKNKLLEHYYHQDQEEEEKEEDRANKKSEKNNEDDKTITKIDGDKNHEMGILASANSSEKTNKTKKKIKAKPEDGTLDIANLTEKTLKKKKDKHEQILAAEKTLKNKKDKHEQIHAVSGDDHDHGAPEDDTLDNAKHISDSQKKKKEYKRNDKSSDLDETAYTEDNRGTHLKNKKKNKLSNSLVDLNVNSYPEKGANDGQRGGSMKTKKKKNNCSIGLDEHMCTEEAEEDNTAVQLKKKKKKKTEIRNDFGYSEDKTYTGTKDAEFKGLEQVKRNREQAGAQSKEDVSMASGRGKANSNSRTKSEKLKGGSSIEHLSLTDDLNVAKGAQRQVASKNREKLESKHDSIFGSGKMEHTTMGGLQKEQGGIEDDQESSESKSSSDENVDGLESEESETSSSSEDDYQIEPESPEKEEAPTVDRETRRLAVVNMDWNHVKAVDLLVLMNSFLPKGGHILSVGVYPSEFGLKQMAEEEVHGPALFGSDDESSEDDQDELDNEKLRQYEKARLRYYFAVIECDRSATADYIYKACDGAEFERTSNVLDLRFIPDDMEFKHRPRDVATEVPTGYDAPEFHTRALQHSKVNISWDDDEPLRVKTLNRKYDPKQLNEMDFQAYLASDDDVSDGDEDDEGDEDLVDDEKKKRGLREKYLSLLESGDPSEGGEDKDDKDMEITFNTGLEELSKRILEKNKKYNSEETVWEAYLRKRSEKRKARKNMSKRSSEDESDSSDAKDTINEDQSNQSDDFFLDYDSLDIGQMTGSKLENTGKIQSKSKALSRETKVEEDASKAELELLLVDDHGLENSVRGYNLKPKKSRGRKHKELPKEDKLPTVDYNDPRFSALFTSHHFAIDPTDPQFKRSATYSRSIVQKQQNKLADKSVDDLKPIVQKEVKFDDSSSKKRKTELSSLIKSVKRKVGTLQS